MLSAPLLHGFGVRYDLPLALSLYIFASALAVIVSFVLVAIFASSKVGELATKYPRIELRWLNRLVQPVWLRAIGGVVGVLVLLSIIITGFFGSQMPDSNPAEYLLWIYFWAGLAVLTGLIGPLWSWLNPFMALHRVIRITPSPTLSRKGEGLERLGYWPAVLLYFLFVSFELASGYANRPWLVATLTTGYTLFTLLGMQLLGAKFWLRHFEFFTILFSIFSRLAPIQFREGRAYLQPWGTALLDSWEAGWDRVTFIILMLSSLAFDGFLATPPWQAIVLQLQPIWQALGSWGLPVTKAFGIIGLTVIFWALFMLFMSMVIYFGKTKVEVVSTITSFALTLVPIAFVYNLAHNYSYLIIQGQGLFPLLADPLARGWHLLPIPAHFEPSFALAGAATVWYAQVILIIIGHIVAVYLAHLRAGERFKQAGNVILSQYPMLLLMVLYTMTSLWILAQPITE